ncbi:substance-P receptor-like [Ptychodera flava]|uniref:substance-P receptor-like n=1 Tax=Ptychodera flava TaxID=63121 RepID=UPI00396A0933
MNREAAEEFYRELLAWFRIMNFTDSEIKERMAPFMSTLPLPTTTDNSPQSMELPRIDQIILASTFVISMALSIVGNAVVLCVLLGRGKRTDLTNFLVNLAVADLTMAIFCMPFTFPILMLGHWIFGSAMCYIVIFLQHVSVIVSIGTLTAVGIDRYFIVLYPMKARFTKNRSKILFIVIWIVAVCISVVQAIFTKVEATLYYDKVVYFCTERYPNDSFAKGWEIAFLGLTYFLPLFILSYAYIRIGVRLWGRHLPGNADDIRDVGHGKSKRKVIKMLVVIVLMFVLCWLPLHIFKLVTLYCPQLYDDTELQDMTRIVNACVLWLAMSNSFVNPFIYCFLNDSFRADLKIVCGSCFVRRRLTRLRSNMRRLSSGRSTCSSRSTVSTVSTLRKTSVSTTRDRAQKMSML